MATPAPMAAEAAPVDMMRTWWELSAVSQFMHLFCDGFGMADFDTEYLESCLLGEQPAQWLAQLQIKMLRFVVGERSAAAAAIRFDNWLEVFASELAKRAKKPPKPRRRTITSNTNTNTSSTENSTDLTPAVDAGDNDIKDTAASGKSGADSADASGTPTTNHDDADDNDLDHGGDEDDSDSDDEDDGITKDDLFYIYELGTNYESLTLRTKVLILHRLCEWQLERPSQFKPTRNVPDTESIHWRVEPVGYDAIGNTFYLFDDNRLYMKPKIFKPKSKSSKNRRKSRRGGKRTSRAQEIVAGRGEEDSNGSTAVDPNLTADKPAEDWVLVCHTIKDWKELSQKYKKSKDPNEKAFYTYLVEDAVPSVVKDLKKIENARLVEEAIRNRKRSTRIQVLEVMKIEEEERKRREWIKAEEVRYAKEAAAKKRAEKEAAAMNTVLSPAAQEAAEYSRLRNAKSVERFERRLEEAQKQRDEEAARRELRRRDLEEQRQRRLLERELRMAKHREQKMAKDGSHPYASSDSFSSIGSPSASVNESMSVSGAATISPAPRSLASARTPLASQPKTSGVGVSAGSPMTIRVKFPTSPSPGPRPAIKNVADSNMDIDVTTVDEAVKDEVVFDGKAGKQKQLQSSKSNSAMQPSHPNLSSSGSVLAHASANAIIPGAHHALSPRATPHSPNGVSPTSKMLTNMPPNKKKPTNKSSTAHQRMQGVTESSVLSSQNAVSQVIATDVKTGQSTPVASEKSTVASITTPDPDDASNNAAGQFQSGLHQQHQHPSNSDQPGNEDDSWYFDCSCGLRGQNIDDGTPIVACGNCNVWKHIACVSRRNGKTPTTVDLAKWNSKDFVCATCSRRRSKRAAELAASVNSSDGGDLMSMMATPLPKKKARQMNMGSMSESRALGTSDRLVSESSASKSKSSHLHKPKSTSSVLFKSSSTSSVIGVVSANNAANAGGLTSPRSQELLQTSSHVGDGPAREFRMPTGLDAIMAAALQPDLGFFETATSTGQQQSSSISTSAGFNGTSASSYLNVGTNDTESHHASRIPFPMNRQQSSQSSGPLSAAASLSSSEPSPSSALSTRTEPALRAPFPSQDHHADSLQQHGKSNNDVNASSASASSVLTSKKQRRPTVQRARELHPTSAPLSDIIQDAAAADAMAMLASSTLSSHGSESLHSPQQQHLQWSAPAKSASSHAEVDSTSTATAPTLPPPPSQSYLPNRLHQTHQQQGKSVPERSHWTLPTQHFFGPSSDHGVNGGSVSGVVTTNVAKTDVPFDR